MTNRLLVAGTWHLTICFHFLKIMKYNISRDNTLFYPIKMPLFKGKKGFFGVYTILTF